MATDSGSRHTRREFLTVAVAVALAAVSDAEAQAAKTCGAATPSQTEGPYYKPNTPMRASLLEPGMPGTKLVIEVETGRMLSSEGKGMVQTYFRNTSDNGSKQDLKMTFSVEGKITVR